MKMRMNRLVAACKPCDRFLRSFIARRTLFACLLLLMGVSHAADGMWIKTSDGMWNTADNWQSGIIASGAGSRATFLNLPGPITVSNDLSGLKLQSLYFSGGGYTIDGLPLTIDGSTGAYTLNVAAGTHSVSAGLTLLKNPTELSVANNASLTLGGLLDLPNSGALVVNKTDGGECVFSGQCTENNASLTLDIKQGTFRVASGAAFTLRGGNRENFRVGNGGAARLVIESGGVLNVAGFALGYNYNSPSTILVDGGVLTANNVNHSASPIGVGHKSDSTMSVSNNAVVDVSSWLSVGVLARGELLIGSGGAMRVSRLSLGSRDDAGTTGYEKPGYVHVGDGTLTASDVFVWRSAGVVSRTNEVTIGCGPAGRGRFRLPATTRVTVNKSFTRLTLDGGGLEFLGLGNYSNSRVATPSLANYLYGLDQFLIGRLGGIIDSSNVTATVIQTLTPDPKVRQDGGLSKLGTGQLTLAGGVIYKGPTYIAEGTLRLQGTLPTSAVTVLPGATLSLVDNQFRTFAPSSLIAGQSGESMIELEVDASGNSDCLTLSANSQLGNVTFALVGAGGAASHWLLGEYVVATYIGEPPDVSGWQAAAPSGVVAIFTIQPVDKRVVLNVTAAPEGASTWLSPTDGVWSQTANWSAMPANDSGTGVLFGNAPGRAVAVTLDAPVTIGTMFFDSPYAYALNGESITFGSAGAGGTLTALQRSYAIGSALMVPEDLTMTVQAGASLLLGGGVTGCGNVKVTGGGTLAITNAIHFDVPLTLNGAILSVPETTTLDKALTLDAGGATLTSSYGKTVTLSGAISGTGDLIKDSASITVLSGANSGTGARAVRNGTLSISSLTDGGELVIGEGTLKYTGPSLTTDKGLTIRTLNPDLGATFETDSDVTFNGNIKAENGAFIKAGKGTMTLNATGNNQLGTGAVFGESAAFNRGLFGESPTRGLRVFQVLDGKVVVGVPGQINTMDWQTVIVGGETTKDANAETAAQLEINGGVWNSGFIAIGRGNGSAVTAPDGLVSAVRVNGGEVTVSGLWLGQRLSDMATITARPLFEMNSGALRCGQLFCGSANGGAACSRLVFNGGFAAITSSAADGVRLAYAAGFTSEMIVSGGTLAISNTVIRLADDAATAKGILRLDSGRLITRGFERLGSGVAELYLNGGVLQPCQDMTLSNLTLAVIQEGGFVTDVPSGTTLTIDQTLSHDPDLGETVDGGVLKSGVGTLTLGGTQTYTGPTVVSGGVLRITGSLAVTNLTLAGGTVLSLVDGAYQVFAPTEFAADDTNNAAVVELDVAADGGTYDVLQLPSGFNGKLTLRLFKSGTTHSFVTPGRYPLLTFTGTAPDTASWTVEEMEGAASFETVGSTIYVRIGIGAGGASVASIWTNAVGGAWADAGNWSVAPANDASANVLFGAAISSPVTITTGGGVTFGYLAIESMSDYTWNGGVMTLGSAESNALARVTQGAHTFNADLSVPSAAVAVLDAGTTLQVNGAITGAGSLAVAGGGRLVLTNGTACAVPLTLDNVTFGTTLSTVFAEDFTLGAGGMIFDPANGSTTTVAQAISGSGGLTKTGSSVLALEGVNTFTGETFVRNGTLSLEAEPAGPLVIGEGTLKFTGPNTIFTRGYSIRTTTATQAATFDTAADITFNSPVSAIQGAFIKSGSGTLTYAGSGVNTLSAGDCGGNTHAVLDWMPFGDTPVNGFRSYTIFNGMVVMGAAGQTNRISGQLTIGGQSTAEAGAETAGHMVFNGGVLEVGDFIVVGRGNGSAVTAPAGLESSFTLNGGDVFIASGFQLGVKLSGMATLTAKPRFTLNSGSLHAPWLVCGGGGGNEGLRPRVEINGGRLVIGPRFPIELAFAQGTETEFTQNGGTVCCTNQTLVLAHDYVGTKGVYTLNGGRLIAQTIMQYGTSKATGIFTFNGGVFEPSASLSLQELSQVNVGAGGAVFDVPAGITYTVSQALEPDAELGETVDGGLVKLGAGTLVIAGTHTYGGATIVSNGTLSVSDTASLVSALAVASGGQLALNASGTALSVAGLTLGSADGAEARLTLSAPAARFVAEGAVNVTGDLFLGKTAVTLLNESQRSPAINGTYVIMTCAGTISGSAADLRVANPGFGKDYQFSVVGGTVLLSVSTTTAVASIWNTTTGGAWSEDANWLTAPEMGAAGMKIGFLDAITVPAVIDAAATSVTAGELVFDNNNGYTLSGSGSLTFAQTNDRPASVTVEQGTHEVELPMKVEDMLDVTVASFSDKARLTGTVTGNGKIVKYGPGRLLLAGDNVFTGGVDVREGTLDVAGAQPAGLGIITLWKNAGLANEDGAAILPNEGAVMGGNIYFGAYWPLTLTGDWITTNNSVYQKVAPDELVVAGAMRPASGSSRLELIEGSVRFASGADAEFRNASVRAHIDFLRPKTATTVRRMTIESGASVQAGCLDVAEGLTNIIAVTGGSLFLSGYPLNEEINALVTYGGANPNSVNRIEVSGGSVYGADNAWLTMAISLPNQTFLDVSGGMMSMGKVSLGSRNNTHSIPASRTDVSVRGGVLEARQGWNWMADGNAARENTVTLEGGRLVLPATYATVTNVSNQARMIFNGGTFVVGGSGESAENGAGYLSGLKQIEVGLGGAFIDTQNRNITITQRLTAQSGAENAAIVKLGLGTLTLTKQPVGGILDVRVGAMRLRPETAAILPSEPALRFSFDNGISQDDSGYGQPVTTLKDDNDTAGLSLVDGHDNGQALRFDGSNALLVNNSQFKQQTEHSTVSLWVRQSSYQTDNAKKCFFSNALSTTPFPHQYFMRILEAGTLLVRGVPGYSTAYNMDVTVADAVPLNTWTMLTLVVDGRNGFSIYVNGERRIMRVDDGSKGITGLYTDVYGAGSAWLFPANAGGDNVAFRVGQSFINYSGFVGDIDDVMVFKRTLSATEIALLYQSRSQYGTRARVAAGAMLDLDGAEQDLAEVAGEGCVVNGTARITRTIDPGDAEALAGALLSVDGNLTFATNAVFVCDWTPEMNDIVDVTGTLTVEGGGTVDLGLTSPDQMPCAPRLKVFPILYYQDIEGTENFSQWQVTGVGHTTATASVSAADGVVTVRLDVPSGMLILLR